MSACQSCENSGCLPPVSRRRFLTTAAGAAAGSVAAKIGLFDLASSLFAESRPAGGPLVSVVFIRPEQTPVISWPGGNCDVKAQQAAFTDTLTKAARQFGVRLDLRDAPLSQPAEVTEYLSRIKASPPDGLIVCAMELFLWERVNQIIQDRGDIPTVVYSNLSGFTKELQSGRNQPKVYVGATQDIGWLTTAVRLLSAIWQMKQTRILFVAGTETRETTVDGLGTVFHWIPKSRFEDEFKQVAQTAEVRELARFYHKHAQKVVEPSQADILEAAKNYVVCRRLMAAERCHGLAIDCLGWKNPVCIAYSRLRDEGIVAACEKDTNATIGMLMTNLLCERPSFQQDPSPNTVNNTLIGAHCTSPLKLEGFAQSYRAPFLLRDYHTRTGVSPQVLWPIDKPVTILQANAKPLSIWIGTGRVVSNIPQPPSGCCRTAVELALDNVADTRDVKGFHQLFVLGNWDRLFRAYGQLAGIPVSAIA
jgi:hypothetical protein